MSSSNTVEKLTEDVPHRSVPPVCCTVWCSRCPSRTMSEEFHLLCDDSSTTGNCCRLLIIHSGTDTTRFLDLDEIVDGTNEACKEWVLAGVARLQTALLHHGFTFQHHLVLAPEHNMYLFLFSWAIHSHMLLSKKIQGLLPEACLEQIAAVSWKPTTTKAPTFRVQGCFSNLKLDDLSWSTVHVAMSAPWPELSAAIMIALSSGEPVSLDDCPPNGPAAELSLAFRIMRAAYDQSKSDDVYDMMVTVQSWNLPAATRASGHEVDYAVDLVKKHAVGMSLVYLLYGPAFGLRVKQLKALSKSP